MLCRHCDKEVYPGYKICKKHLFRRKRRPIIRRKPRMSRRRIPPNHGYVYVVKDTNNGFYKIGYTEDMKKRMGTLNVAHATDLEFVAKFLTSRPRTDEQLTHAFFEEYRVNREWFDLDQDPNWEPRLNAFLLALR